VEFRIRKTMKIIVLCAIFYLFYINCMPELPDTDVSVGASYTFYLIWGRFGVSVLLDNPGNSGCG
jgi:hypothetical protein